MTKKKVGRPRKPDTEISGRAIYQRKWREDLKKYGMTRREKQAWDKIQSKKPEDPETIRTKIQESFGKVKEIFNFNNINKQEESDDWTSNVPSKRN